MPKPRWTTNDQLVMAVRQILKSTEPRPAPVNPHKNPFGVELVDCPICSVSLRPEVYNAHFTYYHGTPFWKEMQLIALIKGTK